MKKLLTICVLHIIMMNAFSQINIGGEPYSWTQNAFSSTKLKKEIVTPALDRRQIEREDEQDERDNQPPRFGYPHSVSLNLDNSGEWTLLPNGDRLWQLKVKCPASLSINFVFDQFHLASNTILFIYNSKKTHKIGGFTSLNNKGDLSNPGGFGTGLVYGDEVILEMYEPAKDAGKNIVRIGKIVHGYRHIVVPPSVSGEMSTYSLGSSGSCQVNVNCSEGNNWKNQKKGVALMLIAGTRWCTGSLVNNTSKNGTLYFLTANHCISNRDAVTNPNAPDFSFMWNYESPSCANPTSEPAYSVTNGATIRANNPNSDFALLQLTESPLVGATPQNIYFNGWSRTNSPSAGGVGIHHPSGDIKKISTYSMTPIGTTTCTPNPSSFWEVSWIQTANGRSVQQPGSSGSPLFQNNGKIIGQLYGPYYCANIQCENPLAQRVVYGRVSASWSGASPQRRLSDWLDPTNTNAAEIDGGYYSSCPNLVTVTGSITDSRNYRAVVIDASPVLTSSADVTLKASTRINLKAGFRGNNGRLRASIVPCSIGVNQRLSDVSDITYDPLIEEGGTLEQIKRVYPNPINKGTLYFGRMANVYYLLDGTGSIIMQGVQADKITIEGLAKGIYILKLDETVEKIIVE